TVFALAERRVCLAKTLNKNRVENPFSRRQSGTEPTNRRIAFMELDPTKWEFIRTRAVSTPQFGCSSLRTSATYKESKEARFNLIPYRTRKSKKSPENCKSRVVDSSWSGIDSRKGGQDEHARQRARFFHNLIHWPDCPSEHVGPQV